MLVCVWVICFVLGVCLVRLEWCWNWCWSEDWCLLRWLNCCWCVIGCWFCNLVWVLFCVVRLVLFWIFLMGCLLIVGILFVFLVLFCWLNVSVCR